MQLIALFLLLSAFVVAERPQATRIGNSLIIPYSTDNKEYLVPDEWHVFGDVYLYVTEYDPFVRVNFSKINNHTYELVVMPNPSNYDGSLTTPLELCIRNSTLNASRRTLNRLGPPINCRGDESLKLEIEYDQRYRINFIGIPKNFEWFIGEGAKGGGGVSCTGGCSVNTISSSTSPSNISTDTTSITHELDVVGTFPGGCTCPLSFQHKPATQFKLYNTAYDTIYTKPQAKIVGANTTNPLTIIVSGTYDKTIFCGAQNGTLELRGLTEDITGESTAECIDQQRPSINLTSPPNNTIINSAPFNITCEASDNTALRNIDLWTNFSGMWGETSTQAYTGLTYNATKNFTVSPDNASYIIACKAKDTKSPNNDQFTLNYTITLNLTTTCWYPGGDWHINCADLCNITSTEDVGGNNVFFYGDGRVNLTGRIHNFNQARINESCKLNVNNGGKLG